MLTLRVKGQDYKLKFGYKALGKSRILKEVTAMQKALNDKKKESEDEDEQSNAMLDMLGDIFDLNSRLVLAALQRYHQEYKVDYDSQESLKNGIEKVYDFMDDYMDEEDAMDIMTLFTELMNDLFDSGFLSRKSEKLEQAMIEMDATAAPTDHLRAVN